ncbi:MAG: IclR family transcriptional regulator [Pseudomonadota bacterium]
MEKGRSIRALAVLEEVARASGAVTANELADRTGLPKATVYRLCDQLLETGMLRRQVSGRGFVCGPALRDLANLVQANHLQSAARHAILMRIARKVGETCNLVIPARLGMTYLDRVETEWPLRLQLPVGTSVPFHATASGKLFLASLPPSRRRQLIDELELAPFTANTITSPEALVAELDQIASQGFSRDDNEFIEEMIAVAVPIVDDAGRFVAALATHGPKQRLTADEMMQFLPALRDAAKRLALAMDEEELAETVSATR